MLAALFESETEAMTDRKMHERRKNAALVMFTYDSMRARGLLNDPEWVKYCDAAYEEALQMNDPENFCYGLMITMHFGGLDVPMEEREELAPPMKRWARLAYKNKEKENV